MKVLKAGALAAILAGSAAYTFWQHQQNGRLMAERAVLHEQVEQAASHEAEVQRLSAKLNATVERLEADRSELMRLRAQSSKVRQLEQENAQLKIERQRLAREVAQAKQTTVLSDQRQMKLPASDIKAPPTPTGVTDLGVVELSGQAPNRLDLGEGKECVVNTIVLADGQLQMVFTFESEIDGVPVQTKQTAAALPGRQIGLVINGVEIALTPTLKTK